MRQRIIAWFSSAGKLPIIVATNVTWISNMRSQNGFLRLVIAGNRMNILL